MIINPYVFGGGSPPGDAYLAAVLADSPVAYWILGETEGTVAADEVGSNDGEYTPSTGSITLGVDGIPGSPAPAAILEGQASVVVDDNAAFRFADDQAFTIEALIKPNENLTIGSGFRGFLSHESGTNGWAWNWSSGDNGIRFLTNNGNIQTTGIGQLDADTWYHMVTVYNGSNDVQWYVQGTPNNSGNPNYGGAPPGGQDFFIGRRAGGGGQPSGDTTFGHIAIYDGALTAQQVADHFAAAGIGD